MSEADKNDAPAKFRHCKECKCPAYLGNVNPKKSLDLVKDYLMETRNIESSLRARQLLISRNSNLDIKTTMGRNEVPVRCLRMVHLRKSLRLVGTMSRT